MLFRRRPRVVLGALRPGNAARAAAIHAEAFHRGWDEGEIADLLRDRSVLSSAAMDEKSSDLLGFALSRRAADEAELMTIAVARTTRGLGVGKQLLDHHLAQLTDVGVTSLFLEVADGNAAALALYDKAGFRKVGERRGYYPTPGGPAATALILRRDAP